MSITRITWRSVIDKGRLMETQYLEERGGVEAAIRGVDSRPEPTQRAPPQLSQTSDGAQELGSGRGFRVE